jgi:phosphatidylinositol kinase/protein kinase (PI-3  family)
LIGLKLDTDNPRTIKRKAKVTPISSFLANFVMFDDSSERGILKSSLEEVKELFLKEAKEFGCFLNKTSSLAESDLRSLGLEKVL